MHIEAATSFPLELTESAQDRGYGVCAEEGKPCLRVYVQSGGCSGFSYAFQLEEAAQIDDLSRAYPGFSVLVDAFSAPLLQGATLDWEESLYGSQFVVKNPSATTTCGCGASFSG